MTTVAITHRRGWMTLLSMRNQVRKAHVHDKKDENEKETFIVDTSKLLMRMEKHGVPSKHADVIISVIVKVLNDNVKNISQLFTSKDQMKKMEIDLDKKYSMLKCEEQDSQDQFNLLQQSEFDKLRTELKNISNNSRIYMNIMIAKKMQDIKNWEAKLSNEMDAQFLNVSALLKQQEPILREKVRRRNDVILRYFAGTVFGVSALASFIAGLPRLHSWFV